VLLGTQPETLFAARLLRLVHRDLPVVAVLHGNLHEAAAGWRSRDPRRRWFDDRAALRAAIGERGIDFVVLDSAVRRAALALGLLPPGRTHVWPEVVTDPPLPPHRPDRQRLRIAFLGAAKRAKGFADFAAISRRLAARGGYEFSLVGALQDSFDAEDLAHIDIPAGFLDRADFLARLARVDYVCLPLREDTYTLTVSGAVLDAIAAARPLLALPTPALRELFRDGPAGFLCDDLAALEAVMGQPDRLADPLLYDQFRASLLRARGLRSPQHLALAMRPMLARGGPLDPSGRM
jgi:glycosyltransferase involved in cell wall biosynthesis